MVGKTRRSTPSDQDADKNRRQAPEPPSSSRRLKRVVDDDEGEESPMPQRKQPRTSEEGAESGGSGSGSGSGLGKRRLSGFPDIESQDADQEQEESYEFTDTQGAARKRLAEAAAKPSKEILIQDKDEKKASELSHTERKALVKAMMRFLIMKGLNHEPATRKEMMDTVLGKEYRSKGVIKYILATADQQLKKTVGFRVKTVAKEKPYYVKDTYYVINTLSKDAHSTEILKGQGQAGRALLTIVLCMIYCSSDKLVAEDEMFRKLNTQVDSRIPLKPWLDGGRSESKKKNSVHVDGLGDVHELLATFVKQHYLVKETISKPTADGGTDKTTAYAMGARYALEIGDMQLLALMAQAMGETIDPTALLQLEEGDDSLGFTQSVSQP